ncbi:MAG TPA: SDR family oxidoreductase [Vicinamibacterales bacterium]|nr:SDR family oxidoreductase [Vicinamibacterales bacterium]
MSLVLVAGGTGVLGQAIVRRLLEAGRRVRVMTRTPSRARALAARGVEVVRADLRDRTSLEAACTGATHVITTANAFAGGKAEPVSAVDEAGNRNLIEVARAARVRQFVFTSARLLPPFLAIDYFAAKLATEGYLRASGLPYTILRPTAFMETWARMLGEPVVLGRKVTIFGPGTLPINFVAVDDVAVVAVMTLDRPDAINAIVEIGGPANHTQLQVVEIFERIAGRRARRSHMPVWLMRALAPAVRPVNPVFARQLQAGAVTATIPQPFDAGEMLARYPIQPTRLADWARRFAAGLPQLP